MSNEFTEPPLSDEKLQEYIDEWLTNWEWGDPTDDKAFEELWKRANKNGAAICVRDLLTNPGSKPSVYFSLRKNGLFRIAVYWGPLAFEILKPQMELESSEDIEGSEEGDEYYRGEPEKVRWGGE